MSDLEREIRTVEDVARVLLRRASFDELLRCAHVAREVGDLDLRASVSERALEVALTQSRPESRAKRELNEAARLVASALMARAQSLEDLPDKLRLARERLRANGQGSRSSGVVDAIADVDNELAHLLLLLSDGSSGSLIRAGALLRKDFAERSDLAIVAMDRVLVTMPLNVPALTVRGAALCDLGMFKEAVAILRQGLKNEPDDSHLRVTYSRALEGVGNFEEALEVAREAARQSPDDEWAMHRWLRAARAADRDKEFAFVLEEVKNLAPRTPRRDQWVELLAIEVLLERGELDAARASFRAVGDPTGAENRRLHERLRKRLNV